MDKRILIQINTSLFDSHRNTGGLDMALAAANYQFTVNIIFLGMGIFTLTQQQPDIIQTTDTLKVWKSLPLYDVENLFILQNELIDHQLNPEEFLLPIKILSQMEYVDLLHEQDIILNY